VLGNLEQEPKPADGRGNERNRKYSVLQTAKHQKRYRGAAKPQRNPRLNLTGQGYWLRRRINPVAAKGKAGGELQAFRAEHHNAGI
jgi:hypothetical protein